MWEEYGSLHGRYGDQAMKNVQNASVLDGMGAESENLKL